MARSNQNQIPFEFTPLYDPILKLKKILMSNDSSPDINLLVRGLVAAHYCTFILVSLYHKSKINNDKVLAIRKFTELITSNDAFTLILEDRSKLYSFIDTLGKTLNTTAKPYIYIAMYSGHLDAELYRFFNSNKKIYDFVDSPYIKPSTLDKMHQFYLASKTILETRVRLIFLGQ